MMTVNCLRIDETARERIDLQLLYAEAGTACMAEATCKRVNSRQVFATRCIIGLREDES